MELERPDGAGGGYRRKDDLPDLPASSAPPAPAVPVAGAAILPVAGAALRTEVRSPTASTGGAAARTRTPRTQCARPDSEKGIVKRGRTALYGRGRIGIRAGSRLSHEHGG
jgi:hypothetical protein